MGTRQINVSIDEQTASNAENILDDLGLDFQTSISMFLKRIVKEGGINFLFQNKVPTIEQSKITTEKTIPYYTHSNEIVNCGTNMQTKKSYTVSRNNNAITEEMRDYIWDMFINNKNLSYSDYQILAGEVNIKTGMNQGSAYIYFVILSCFMQGKPNTRTMKFADLTYYVKRILKECPKHEYEATLQSLEQSIPYWTNLNGNFAIKVQKLVNQYKQFL